MPDLDELLDDGFAAYARDSAHPSDVDALIRRGVLRRHRSHVRVVGSAMLAVAVIVVLGIVGIGGGSDDRPQPAPSPVEFEDMTPEQIVHDADARLETLAVSDDDPDVRASVWSLCKNDRCNRERNIIAVTQDGFDSTEYVELQSSGRYASVGALSSESFYVEGPRFRGVLTPDATLSPLRRSSTVGTLAADETVVFGAVRPLAVDASGNTHPLSIPDGARLAVEQPGGRLVALTFSARRSGTTIPHLVWSDDDGATWSQRRLPVRAGGMFMIPYSADPDTIAVVESVDGATLAPFVAMHVSRDGGTTWKRIPALADEEESGYVGWTFVRSDGRLLAGLIAWSDDGRDNVSRRSRGPYLSEGLDWSHMSPSDEGLPGDGTDVQRRLQSITQTGDDISLYLSQGAQAYVSHDGGRTWQETPAR